MSQPQATIDRILALAATGQSRAEISARFPDLSRSAVCGILWRRGVAPPPLSAEEKAAKATKAIKVAKVAIKAVTVVVPTIVVPIRPRDLLVEITAIAVPLPELGDNACHWANR